MDTALTNKKVQLTFASPFPKGVLASFRGELIRISHVGDADGMSPVYNVIDSEGKSAWVPQSEVQILDQDYRPISQESLDVLTSQARQAGRSPVGTSR